MCGGSAEQSQQEHCDPPENGAVWQSGADGEGVWVTRLLLQSDVGAGADGVK